MVRTTSHKTVARDVFLYLLMIFVLASSAGSLGVILFQLIERYIPVADATYYVGSYYGDTLKFPVASLVIMFPVLVWVVRFLKRDMTAHPEKRELKIRKWLLYLMLFVAGLTMLGDLVTLVLGFLNGNIVLRFLLEVLVVFWLAGSIFYYFLKDLYNQAPAGRRIIEWTTILVVVASLVASLFLIGSPATQRARTRDDQRVNALQSIENQVIQYWQAKGRLPTSLANLPPGTISGFEVPVDPTPGQQYVYSVVAPLKYRLCATFETDNTEGSVKGSLRPIEIGGGVLNWQHAGGYQCFDGTIDPDRFGPTKPVPQP